MTPTPLSATMEKLARVLTQLETSLRTGTGNDMVKLNAVAQIRNVLYEYSVASPEDFADVPDAAVKALREIKQAAARKTA